MRLVSSSNGLALLLPLLAAKRTIATSTTETDVVVVGGGFSGLAAAYELHQAGLKTVVLEAKEAIGGRCRSIQRESNPGIIELGATWINNVTQPDVYALTQKFGLDVAVQYVDGDFVKQDRNGKVERTAKDNFANTNDPELAELVVTMYGLIDEVAAEIDLYDWSQFPEEQDVTMAEWMARQDEAFAQSEHINATLTSLSASLVGREAHEVGAHYLLDYIGSGGGLEELGDEGEFGAQYLKVKQGTSAIAQGLADELGSGSVHVSTPVEAITHCNDHTIVASSNGQLFRAKKVILANPTNTYDSIAFQPALPKDKTAVVSKTMPGVYAKLIVSYETGWWRDAGLVGDFTSLVGPVCFSWDTSDKSIDQYSLAIFVAGDVAREWHALPSEDEKKAAVVEHLAELAGPELAEKARNPVEIHMVEWTFESYLEGGPTSSMGPGLLRKYGKALREPFGDLHFAGGETAYEWKGYLEGAIRAGRRAAKEVIGSLGCQSE